MKVRTKRKNVKSKLLELENQHYKEIIELLKYKIESDNYLKEENKKMLDWIRKILKEFGTREVGERKIEIPIMKKKDYIYADNNLRMKSETIIIPEIIINKVEY